MSLLKLRYKKTSVELEPPSTLTCPAKNYEIPKGLKGPQLSIARLYANYGDIINKYCRHYKIETPAALAVINVEAGGVGAYDGASQLAVIRVEARPPLLSQVRFPDGEAEFKHKYGRGQNAEWKALAEWFAMEGERACYWTSFGLGQIMGFNYALVNCSNPVEVMLRAQSSSAESAKMFFDFVDSKKIIPALQAKEWFDFAQVYNGTRNAKVYARKIADCYDLAVSIL